MKPATLFFSPAGPLIEHKDGTLHISDLNPETRLTWALSRWELFVLGLRCVLRAAFPR